MKIYNIEYFLNSQLFSKHNFIYDADARVIIKRYNQPFSSVKLLSICSISLSSGRNVVHSSWNLLNIRVSYHHRRGWLIVLRLDWQCLVTSGVMGGFDTVVETCDDGVDDDDDAKMDML